MAIMVSKTKQRAAILAGFGVGLISLYYLSIPSDRQLSFDVSDGTSLEKVSGAIPIVQGLELTTKTTVSFPSSLPVSDSITTIFTDFSSSLVSEPTTAISATFPSSPPVALSDDSATVNLTSTLVIARLKKADVGWVKDELPDSQTAIYVVDDRHAEFTVPENKGNEAMVYLTYMIDHYDSLPDVSIFTHSDRITWHNNDLSDSDLVKMVRRLNLDWVRRTGYVNLRCHHAPGCDDGLHLNREDFNPNKQEETVIKTVWSDLHPFAPMPDIIAHPCCAQFAVSKQTLRKYSREQYIKWRDWLLETKLEDKISGRIWEYTWHYIFSGQAKLCLDPHLCYCDGYSICFKSYADSDDFWAFRDERGKINDEYNMWKKVHDRTDSEEANREADEYELRLQGMQDRLDARKAEALVRGDDSEKKQQALESKQYNG